MEPLKNGSKKNGRANYNRNYSCNGINNHLWRFQRFPWLNHGITFEMVDIGHFNV